MEVKINCIVRIYVELKLCFCNEYELVVLYLSRQGLVGR